LMVYENRVLKRISETKEEDVKGELRRLHNEESLNSCSSIIIIKVEKSRMVRWVGQVARKEIGKMYTKSWSVYLKGRDHSVHLSVDGRTVSGWILGKRSEYVY